MSAKKFLKKFFSKRSNRSSSIGAAGEQSSRNPSSYQHDTAGNKIPSATGGKPGLKATTYGATKMALGVITDFTDVFVPLKSAAGGLNALLKLYDQFIANKNDVRRLIGQVESLTALLTGPPQKSDVREIERRSQLKRSLNEVLEMLNPMVEQSNITAFLNNADQAANIISLVESIRDAIITYQTSLQQGLNENTVTTMESVLFDKLPRAKGAKYMSGKRQKCLRGTRVKVLEEIENWVHDHGIRRVYWLNGIAGTGKTTIAQSFAERMFAIGLLGASFFCSRDFIDQRNLHLIFPTLAFQLAYKYPNFRSHLVDILKSDPDIGHESLSTQLKKLIVEPLQSTALSTVIIIDALDECDDEEPASAILSLLAREIEHIPLVKFFITGRPEPRIRKGFRLPTLHPQTEVLLLHEVERQDVNEDIRIFVEHHLKELVKDRSDVDLPTSWPAPEDVQTVVSKAAGLFIYASTVINFLNSDIHAPQERLRLITSTPDKFVHEGQSGIDWLYTCVFRRSCSHIRDSDSGYFHRLQLVIGSVMLLCEPVSVASLATLLGVDSKDLLTPIRSLHSVLLVPDSDSKLIRVFHKSLPDYLTDSERCKDSRFLIDSPAHHAILALQCLKLMTSELKENICDLPPYSMNGDIDDLSIRRQNFTSEALVYASRFWARHLRLMSGTGDQVARVMELLNEFVRRHLLQWLEVMSVVKDLHGAVHSLIDVEQWLLKVKTSDNGLVDLTRECRRFILHSFDAIDQSAVHIYHSALVWPPACSVIRRLYQSQLIKQVKVLSGIDDTWDACVRSIHLGGVGLVSTVAFSHGGDLIAGCSGHVVKILEATTGVCLATLDGHKDHVNSFSFSPDDIFVASGSRDDTIKVWDVQTGGLVRTLIGHTGVVLYVAFSPTGTMIASGSMDCTVRIWSLSTGDCGRILDGHSDWVRSVCWLGTNKVVSGSDDRMVTVWDVESGEHMTTFDGHSGSVRSVACSLDSSKIASGLEGGVIRVYDARTSDVIHTVSADCDVRSICFSPDGDKIAYATRTLVVVWDLVKDLVTFKSQLVSQSVAFSPDGNWIAVGLSDGFVKVFQMETEYQGHSVQNQHSNTVLCVAVAADGRTIASGSSDRTVKLWDSMTGSCVHTFQGHSSIVSSVAFSPDSSLVSSGSNDNTVRIWSVPTVSVNTSTSLHTFQGHTDGINSVAFSPDSSLVASGSHDKTIRIWSLHNRSLIGTLQGHSKQVVHAVFSRDGSRIVSASYDQEIMLWDVNTMEKLAFLPGQSFAGWDSRVCISADEARVILQARAGMKRWSICSSVSSSDGSNSSSEGISFPMVLLQISDEDHVTHHEDIHPYRYLKDSEWILDQRNRQMCWIPADLRGCSDYHDERVVLGTRNGRIVVLDFSDIPS